MIGRGRRHIPSAHAALGIQAFIPALGMQEVLLQREQLVSTYLGESIAIPHGTIEAKDKVKRTGVVICQYPAGVRFGPEADEVARLVIGIAARNDEHLQVINRLTNALDDPELIEKLATTQDPHFVLDLLSGHRAA